mmetsp:Transcript_33795/g.71052  ORF Transcript_33795/g.71052 Transcript_33795/m.71052 type:complete len:584 (-) Transcript_33795:82-1833(-)
MRGGQKKKMNMKGKANGQENNDDVEIDYAPLDDDDDDDECIELVLATKDNTKHVGWLISDGEHAIGKEHSIPFYDTVKEGANFVGTDWKDQAVVRQAKIGWRDDLTISWMERHMQMTQGFLLIGKAPGLLVLGEPTHDRDDLTDDEKAWPDWSRTKGYILPAGCGIIIKKGTWHDFPVSVGPELTTFVINTKEVIDALMSMKEPAPMDFGDCYKVRLADRGDGRRVFPDPRPFVKSLGLLDGDATHLTSSSSESKSTPGLTFEYGHGMRRAEVSEWGGPHANYVWVVPIINVESFDSKISGPSVTRRELAKRGWHNRNRQGLKRLGRVFSQHAIPCTAVLSSNLVDNKEVMTLLHHFKKDNRWEIGAHGEDNSNSDHAGLPEAEEAGTISRSLQRLGVAFQDDEPKTWLAPEFSVTRSTPRLLSQAGVETLLDFNDDDVPFELVREKETPGSASFSSNSSLVCLPYSIEVSAIYSSLGPREYAVALESHILQMAKESRESGTPSVVCMTMHVSVAGTPASAYELEKMLCRLESQENIKWATAKEVTGCVRKRDAKMARPRSPEVDGTDPFARTNSAAAQVSKM